MSTKDHPSQQALFRFTVVSQALARTTAGAELRQVVGEITSLEQPSFDGSMQRISPRTLYRWISAFEEHGLAGLEPKQRQPASSSKVLSNELLQFLIAEKRADRRASVPELIRRAVQHRLLAQADAVDRSTVYRTLQRQGLAVSRARRVPEHDKRRFAFPHRMDMLLCDGKHFRAGAGRQKRVAFFYIDDATRLVLDVVVGTSETSELFQQGLYRCISSYGFPSRIYLDRGPGFKADATAAVVANLEILLILGTAGYPEGHGKIERFNRTADADLLRGLDGRPDVDPTCSALELRLHHYLHHDYAHRPHEGLKGDAPWQRFHDDPRPLRFPESHEALRAKFEIWLRRLVSPDHLVAFESVLYEMPRGYAKQRVLLKLRLLDGSIWFVHEGRLIQLHPVDLHANATARRAKGEAAEDDVAPMPPVTAAEIAFRRDFAPLVDGDGGFPDPDPTKDLEEDRSP